MSAYSRKTILFITLLIFTFLVGCSKFPSGAKNILLMDTFIRVEVKDSLQAERKERVIAKATDRMRDLEKRFNYFLPDSELSKFNSSKKKETFSLSSEMRTILKKAGHMRKLTGGAFDIAIGPDGKVNLGGIAKGYIVDEGIRSLKESGVTNAIINAGGDMRCLGDYKIGIMDPAKARSIVAFMRVRDKAVATSGCYERPAHIIDPRTGRTPQNTLTSVTVIADDCMTADALATALYVLGFKEGLMLIENIPDVDCIIIDLTGEIYVSGQINLTKVRQ